MIRRLAWPIVALAVIAAVLTGATAPVRSAAPTRVAAYPFPLRVHGVTTVAQLIGPSPSSPFAPYAPSAHSLSDTTRWGICAGDLGSLIYMNGRAYITIGDNYTSCPPGTGGPGGGLLPPDWRSNALGIIDHPDDFAHGLHIDRWYSHDGKKAAEVIPSQHNAGDCQDSGTPGCEVTIIPTYGFAVQGHLFLAYMSVHHWGDASAWDVNYSSFSMSADGGKTWTNEKNTVRWGAKSNFAQMAVAPDPDGTHLLFYGIPGGRFGSVMLMRTANDWRSVLSPHSYQYYAGVDTSGRPIWSGDPARAAVVAGAPVGELSVIYDPGLKLWLMTYLQGGNDAIRPSSDDLVIRSATHYWGPWSAPATLVSHTAVPGLYGAFMNQHFLANGGHTLFFVTSEWGPYSIFWMRASL